MKDNKILTISVAAYNLGKMIEKNIQSFVSSKYKDEIEVIITNDGSTDDTAKVVEKYVCKYPTIIKLINKKNEGAGSTVNSGIMNATGKYFKMVDGDDWVNTSELDCLIEKLKNSNEKYDMILTNHEIFSSYKDKIIDIHVPRIAREGLIIDIDELPSELKYSMHNVTYRTAILQENSIKLDNGFYTDQEYLIYPIAYIKNVVWFDLNVYVYLVGREGQSMNIKSLQNHIDMHRIVTNHLIDYYLLCTNKKLAKSNLNIIEEKVVNVIKHHMFILMSYKMNKKNKNNFIIFCNFLKDNYRNLYDKVITDSKIGIAVIFNYKLLPFASIIYRIKLFIVKR